MRLLSEVIRLLKPQISSTAEQIQKKRHAELQGKKEGKMDENMQGHFYRNRVFKVSKTIG